MKNNYLFTLLFCLLLGIFNGQSQTISQWRGIHRDGMYPDKGLLKTWPEAGPRLLWDTETIGNGYSSPVILGDRLYINGEIDSISYVFAFDLSGKLMWKTSNGREFFGEGYAASFPGARSAPTVYDNLIYISSGMGRIACLEASTGKEKWTADIVKDLGGKLSQFGYSESLFVDEAKVYCFAGGSDSNLVALDRFTGKMVWSSKALGDGVSFCSPILIQLPERKILVTLSHQYLMGVDASDGKLLWSMKEEGVKYDGEYCNTPIYSDGFIYGVSGVDNGTGAYKLELSPDGTSIKEIWRNSDVKNAFGGFVLIKNRLYCAAKDNKLKVVDVSNGAVIDSLMGMKGSVISADNQLYCYSDNGRVNLVKLSEPKMEVVSKFKIEKGTKEHFSHPVIANGVLYVRHGNALMAYEIK